MEKETVVRQTFRINKKLWSRIEKKKNQLGYRTNSAFVSDSLRYFLKEKKEAYQANEKENL